MRRSTLVILILFVLTAGAYYYLNNRAPEAADIAVTLEPTTPITYLFDAGDGVIDSFELRSKTGEAVGLERNADKAWVLKLPTEASADQGSVEAAATQLAAIRIEDTLPAGVTTKDVGLDAPAYTLTLQFASGVERKALIGVLTPSEAGYYASLDGDPRILIISRDAVDVLLGLLTNPPYTETPTPPPTTP